MKIAFSEAAKVLKKLGVSYVRGYEYRGKPGTSSRKQHDLPLFSSVILPFTVGEWCHLMMANGELYMGGCCGTMSAVQDILNKVFRFDSGCIRCRDLSDIATLMVAHGEEVGPGPNFKTLGDLDKSVERWPTLSPWEKMAVIWHLVEGCYEAHPEEALRKDIPEVDKAAHIVGDSLRCLSFNELFSSDNRPASQAKADRLLALYRALPALKTLWEKIGEMNPGALEGFAIIDKENGGEVASNGHGLCVFASKDEAEALVELWRKNRKEHKDDPDQTPIDKLVGIERVRVSVEKGLEFLDRK